MGVERADRGDALQAAGPPVGHGSIAHTAAGRPTDPRLLITDDELQAGAW
jgi:hypothetical protein